MYIGNVGCVAGYSRFSVRRACLSFETVGFSLCKTGYGPPTKVCELCMDPVATELEILVDDMFVCVSLSVGIYGLFDIGELNVSCCDPQEVLRECNFGAYRIFTWSS